MHLIKRDIYLKQLIDSRNTHHIKIMTGIRRCGKSFLLFKFFTEWLNENGVDQKHIVHIDLEDRRNLKLRDPDALLEYIDSKLTDDDMHYVMIDEIQHVPEFEDVLNSYLKVDNADLYVTGSNSRFLSTDVITTFRGRGDEIIIVSQADHAARAVYLAETNGIKATGVAARTIAKGRTRLRLRVRGWLARDKMMLDLWLGKQPYFLGERHKI